MEIKNRLFPYPVLCDETDDYNDDTCDVTSRTHEDINDIRIHVEFHLQNTKILDLIREGCAEYALHLECSTTSFRKLIRSNINEIDYSIPKTRVNTEIAVLAMVIARRKITNFYSDDLNEDYAGTVINFDKASILAYRNLPKIFVYKNYEELAGNDSIFTIVKVANADSEDVRPLAFDLSDDKIKILVDPKTYAAYIHFQQMPAIAMSLLVLPAMIYAIDELRTNFDSFSNRHWFNRMKQYYKAQGKDFQDYVVNSDKNIVELAQEMLKDPIGKAYMGLLENEV